MTKNWFKNFFEEFYFDYFYLNTQDRIQDIKEVDFIIQTLGLSKKSKILDLACGVGRHAIRLAKKGFNVVGLDFSKKLIEEAKKNATKEDVLINFKRENIKTFSLKEQFDAIILMYTSFGYFVEEKDNIQILNQIRDSLKNTGLFLLDLPNKQWVMEKVPRKTWRQVKDVYILEEKYFDEKINMHIDDITILNKEKIKKTKTFLRLYSFSEINQKLKENGFYVKKTFGSYDKRKFNEKLSPRMILLAQKL